MTIVQQVSGVTASGRKLYRKKTFGLGTKSGFDLKNSWVYPSTVAAPLTSVPDGTLLRNLSYGNGFTAQVSGANAETAGGGLTLASGKKVILDADFKIPAAATRWLIIAWLKHGTQTLTAGSQIVLGWASNTGSNANWGFYISSANTANYNFIAGGKTGGTIAGHVAGTVYQVAMEMIVSGGNLTINLYQNGVFNVGSTQAAAATFPQPAGSPEAGGVQINGTNGPFIGEIFSVESIDMTLEDRTAAQIVAADYAAWNGRFT